MLGGKVKRIYKVSDEKLCSKCQRFRLVRFFYKRRSHRAGEYYDTCKECMKIRGIKYYRTNHDRQLQLALVRKARYKNDRREWLNKIKSQPCADCGRIFHPCAMDFDHRVGEVKTGSISRLALWKTSNFETIKTEIEKCDLVCSNCHRVRTYNRIHYKSAAIANVVKALL